MTALTRVLPLGVVASGSEYKHYKHDCLAFALSLVPELVRHRFDVIHFIDPPMARILRYLLKALPIKPRLVFTNGCNLPPEYYPPGPHIQHVAEPLYLEALAEGVPHERMTMIPCGIFPERFVSPLPRADLRRKHGIPEKTFVILAVAAIKRIHKRVDHIIEEVARLEGDVLLWIDGNLEDPTLIALAHQRLGSRLRITHVPSDQVKELYALSDVLAHASLLESFGLSIVEALSTGLMVLVHDTPHFRWLVQAPECLVDMSVPGALASRLRQLIETGAGRDARARERADRIRERFDWRKLAPAYADMYRKVALPLAAVRPHAAKSSAVRSSTP